MRDCGCDNMFRMFEGYYGPYFTPTVDAAGNLTWKNNAGLPNPPAVNIKGPRGDSGSGALTDEQKQAILQLARKVAYIDANGQSYYDDLYDAFYGSAPAPTLTSITATYTQTGTIYTTDSVDVIPQRGTLVVTAHYSDGSSAVVASGYTLTGSLTEGASTVTVSYQGLTTTITVQVTAVAGAYTISNNLTGCTTSNSATTIAEGGSYTATITASVGYTLTGATATITMGGTELTGAFNNGTISIPNVTGNLVITVVAAARTVSSISAVYTQSGTVYDTDSLDSLKDDLVVTATYSDSTTAVIPAADYTLSGTLTANTTSTITVNYQGKTATFTVTVSAVLYPLQNGTHEFTGANKGYVTITNHSHVEAQRTDTTTPNYNFVCLSNLDLNGTAMGANTNINNHPAVFTLNAGDNVRFVVSNVSGDFDDYTIGLRKALGTTSVAAVATQTGDCDTVVSVPTTDNVSCLFLYFGTQRATTKNIVADVAVYVNNVRYF